jgi:WD40 repeat protein
MKLTSARGVKSPIWQAAEMLRNDDINEVAKSLYQFITDTFAVLSHEQGTTSRVLGGLRVLPQTDLTLTVETGGAVSFDGEYYDDINTFEFVAESGAPFAVVLPENTNVTLSAADGTNPRIDVIEIRPVRSEYDPQTRKFRDPVTNAISSAVIPTNVSYQAEIQVVEGTPAASPSAPASTAGWIKIAEVTVPAGALFLPSEYIVDYRDAELWNTESSSVLPVPSVIPNFVYNSDNGKTYKSRLIFQELDGAGWSFSGHSMVIYAIAVSPDESKIYTVSFDNTAREINAIDGSAGWVFTGHGSNAVRDVVANPNGFVVYTCGDDGGVREINAADGSEGWVFAGHTSDVMALAVSPDGLKVYSGDDDGLIKEINAADGSGGWTFVGSSGWRSLAVSPDGSKVYAGGLDSSVTEINAADGASGWVNTDPSTFVSTVAVSPDGSRVYAGGVDNVLREINAADGSSDFMWTVNFSDTVRDIAVSPDGSKVYACSSDNTIGEINAADGSEGWVFTHSDEVWALNVSKPSGANLYFGSSDSDVWELKLIGKIRYEQQ